MPDGVTGTDFQTKDLDRECEFYKISSDRRLLRWQENGELKDTLFDGLDLNCDRKWRLPPAFYAREAAVD